MISFKTGAFIYGVCASGLAIYILIDIEHRLISILEELRKEK